MTVWVLSAWHNEAALAPFFLSHYWWADRIVLLIGSDTIDASRSIVSKYGNAEVRPVEFPGGLLDDGIKIEVFNSVTPGLPADWVIAVDADEFVFAPRFEDVRAFLARQGKASVVEVGMWQVYRHVTECDLDESLPAVPQRRHGRVVWHHFKPCVVRPEARIAWEVGHHGIRPNQHVRLAKESLLAVHWAFAEAEIAIGRYIEGRSKRMTQRNRDNSWGFHTHRTKESILQECRDHRDDPFLPCFEARDST